MASTFTWIPSYSTEVDETTRVKTVQYGDGYQQDSDDGLNPTRSLFSVVFSPIDDTTLTAILTFLRAAKGSNYFLWTPPVTGYQTIGTYKCTSWKVRPMEWNSSSLSMTFMQVFEFDSAVSSSGGALTDNANNAFTDNAGNPFTSN